MSDNLGWNKKLPMEEWTIVCCNEYEGWELVGGHPDFVELEIINNKDVGSDQIAADLDDWIKGNFYYRDWTNSGLPFVSDGETYRSGFWFQYKSDAEAFRIKLANKENPLYKWLVSR